MILEPSVIAPSSGLALSLDDAKHHLRLTHTDSEDTYVLGLIEAAQEYVERRLGEALTIKTYLGKLDKFPTVNGGAIEIPNGPVGWVQVMYYQTTSTIVECTGFATRIRGKRVQLTPPTNGWPSAVEKTDAVQVQYSAGYASVPAIPKQMIKLLLATWFSQRESVAIGTSGAKSVAIEHTLDALARMFAVSRYGGLYTS